MIYGTTWFLDPPPSLSHSHYPCLARLIYVQERPSSKKLDNARETTTSLSGCVYIFGNDKKDTFRSRPFLWPVLQSFLISHLSLPLGPSPLFQGICPGNRLQEIRTYDSGCYSMSPASSPCPSSIGSSTMSLLNSSLSMTTSPSLSSQQELIYENSLHLAALQRQDSRRSWQLPSSTTANQVSRDEWARILATNYIGSGLSVTLNAVVGLSLIESVAQLESQLNTTTARLISRSLISCCCHSYPRVCLVAKGTMLRLPMLNTFN